MKPLKTQEPKAKPKQMLKTFSEKPKLYRNELKEMTNGFLPKPEQLEFEESEFRGPTYKYMMSNAFMPKNDHAYQMHYYRPPEPEGEFLFLKGEDRIKRR